jgi:hypothetical protein
MSTVSAVKVGECVNGEALIFIVRTVEALMVD